MKTPFKIECYFTDRDAKNLAFHVGENKEQVLKNHSALAKKLGYKREKLIHMQQVHSDNIVIVTNREDFEHPPTCDAVITDKVNTPLMVMVADCSPILLYDKNKGVIAAIHAGRAGAFSNILTKVIDIFLSKYHSKREDIFVKIGASIKKCCYEVSSEIEEEAKALELGYAIERREGKIYLDISTILLRQLKDASIDSKNIEISPLCTACQTQRYFSYRKEGKTGRFAGVIKLSSS